MKFLIVGLGNIGEEYWGTRHNMGFRIVNELVNSVDGSFREDRYGAVARIRVKNAELTVLKPNTFMNLSGNAVRFWLKKESIDIRQLLVVVDDLALSFGTLRLKPKGTHAGHNGLRNIEEMLGTSEYPRLRFGLGNNFPKGRQFDFVLSQFEEDEMQKIPELVEKAVELIKGFCLEGVERAMSRFN
jgi:PTH1 family peptidyl-tRNA hydrolase